MKKDGGFFFALESILWLSLYRKAFKFKAQKKIKEILREFDPGSG